MLKKTYGTLEYKDGKWLLDKVLPFIAIRLKALFPKIPKHEVCPFTLRDNPETAVDLLWFFYRYPIEYIGDSKERLTGKKKEYLDKQDRLFQIVSGGKLTEAPRLNEPYKFRDYQTVFVNLFNENKRVALMDDMGIGKSLSSLGVALKGELPMLVVCQTSLVGQWTKVIKQFTNLTTHEILVGKQYTLPKVDIYVTKYTMLAKWVDIIVNMNFRVIAFDEVQELRRDKSDKYGAAKTMVDHIEYVTGLSGTPIYNYADEIFNVMNIIAPDVLGNRQDFFREWCGNGDRVFNPEALGTFLQDSFHYIRRTKKDVGLELDEVSTIVHTVDFDDKELDSIEDRAKILATRMFTGLRNERGQAARQLDIMARQATGIGKAKGVAAYVKVFLDNKIPIILLGWHRKFYEIVLKELEGYKIAMYTGHENPKEKEKSLEKFLSGEVDMLLASLRSLIGRDGLQERCSTMIFGEFDWSPQVHKQNKDRIVRPGQKEPCMMIYLKTDSGSDPPMMDVLADKSSDSDALLNPLGETEMVNADDGRVRSLAKIFLGECKYNKLKKEQEEKSTKEQKKGGASDCVSDIKPETKNLLLGLSKLRKH